MYYFFYTFYQAPNDLEFLYDPENGISRYVVIEAETAFHANALANDKGLTWNHLTGIGERWYSVSKKDEHDLPSAIGFEVDLLSDFDPEVPISKVIDGPEGYVHFLDKTFVGFWF